MSNRYYGQSNSTILRVYPVAKLRMFNINSAWYPTTISEEFIRRTDLHIPDTWALLKGVLYEAP